MAYKEKSPFPIVEGGTNATTFATTDGTVYFDGTRLVTTATGTAGQVLTSAGAGVAPSYTSAGSWVFIASHSANNTSPNLDFTSGITNAYDTYAAIFTNIVPAAQDSLALLLSTNGGSTYANTGYNGTEGGINVTTGLFSGLVTGVTTSWFVCDNISASSIGASGNLFIYGLTNGNDPAFTGSSFFNRAGTLWATTFGGTSTPTTVNALRFTMSGANNITSGTITLFGIKES